MLMRRRRRRSTPARPPAGHALRDTRTQPAPPFIGYDTERFRSEKFPGGRRHGRRQWDRMTAFAQYPFAPPTDRPRADLGIGSHDDGNDAPADDGERAEPETDGPERDPLDDPHERVDGGVADDRTDPERDGGRGRVDPGEAPGVEKRQDRRAKARGDREQERQPERRRGVITPEQQRARRHPGPGDARQDRESLGGPDEQRVGERRVAPPAHRHRLGDVRQDSGH